MTEETANKIVELLELFTKSNKFASIILIIFLLGICALGFWEGYRLKKIKKMHDEWKATLTEEQIKLINKHKEYMK